MFRRTLLAAALLAPGLAWALPDQFAQEGIALQQNGDAIEGLHDIRIRMYDAARGGNLLFDETHAGVELVQGYYFVAVGSVNALPAGLFSRPAVFLGITLDNGDELAPRTQLLKVPAAITADTAIDVTGDIHPTSVSIGNRAVIDNQGRWVGDATGLRGPAGPAGPAGAVGPVGPPGPAGGDADPNAVVPLVVQDLANHPDRLPYLRKNANDTTSGSLTFQGGHVEFQSGGVADSIRLNNNNLVGANSIHINDPGGSEGLIWDGTQGRIVVSPLNNGDGNGYLRLVNPGGISLEGTTLVQGDLSIRGAITAVQRIVATVADITTANIQNANIANLNGIGGPVNVNGDLQLNANVRVSDNTSFVGTVRAGAVQAQGNVQANGSVGATGNVTAGARLVGGNQGIWVGGTQVFDGNGNLVRRPQYPCPAGQVLQGTDANGAPMCANTQCPVGQFFRGVDANRNPICQQDNAGLAQLPANQCPAGQAVLQVMADGRTVCGAPRAGDQHCPDGQFMVGLGANGSVVCADAPEGGGGNQERQPRPNVMLCGGSSRDVRTFFPAGSNFQLVNGCAPDGNTQALLISRGGQGQYNANTVRTYVQQGGLVLTEFNISDEVFSAVFQVNVAQGARQGSCQDNPMPVARVNANDRFWTDNANLPLTAANLSSCGYEVGAFPGITPLGGWSANQINLAYRDLDLGRVWLVDADWQDNEPNFSAASRTIMGYMISHGARAANQAPHLRANLMLCGNSSRDPRTFIPAGVNLNLVNGCSPDNQTQALLITRSGNGRFNAQQIEQYVNGGGIVLTEYSISDAVFNAVFGTNVGRGPNRGSCRDNIMPVAKVNLNDPFWQANNNLQTVAANLSGCGYEVGAFPGITALGGWAANQINLAYRDHGQGRLWLTDSDWQDNDNSWQAASTTIMGYMITHGPGGGGGGANAFEFQGIRQNVADGDIHGWRVCHHSLYGQAGASIAQMTNDCSGAKVMYGCRPVGSATWTLLAQGNRDVVFRDTGNGNNMNQDNGVFWYFSSGWSIGFSPNNSVQRNSCDVVRDGTSAQRMCWHTGGGNMNSGYRCGDNSLNGNNSWERQVWTLDDQGGGGGGNVFTFQGVRQNTPDNQLAGWHQCYIGRYNENVGNFQNILNQCQGDHIMYGCRPAGNANWTLLAQGSRQAVFTDTGNGNNTTRDNGVEWYYSLSWSMGFAPQGQAVSRNSCDTQGGAGDQRMCWHTGGGSLNSGYRCGNNFLNGNNGWERAVWGANIQGGGGQGLWLSRGGNINPPNDPRGFSGRNDLNDANWSDGGNDAFDGWGTLNITFNGQTTRVSSALGQRDYNIGGYPIRVISEFPNQFRVWRVRILPTNGNNDRRRIHFQLTGNLGSDGSTRDERHTFAFQGQQVPWWLTWDGGPSDPPVHRMWITSNPAELGGVQFSRNGDNENSSIDATLPLTIYTAITYADHDQTINAMLQDIVIQ